MPETPPVSLSVNQPYASVATQSSQSLQPFNRLNVSESQRTALRSIFHAAKMRGTPDDEVQRHVAAVLTPAQQAARAGAAQSAAQPQAATSPAASPLATAAPVTLPASAASTSAASAANQAAAAKAARINALLQQVLSGNRPTPIE